MSVKTKITRALARQSLKLKKNSPHIMFAGGMVCVVTGAVLACKATLKAEPLLDDIKAELDHIKRTDLAPEPDRRDIAYVYGKSTVKLVNLYSPALIVGGVGLAALTGAHVQMTRRNTALTIAYAGLHKAYMEYRARVRSAVGEERELDLYFGATDETVVGEDGKKKTVKVVDPNALSPYARFFDEGSPNWQKNAEYNRLHIQCQQNYANNMLQARGYLFLNEVYTMLGINMSSAGQAVGWFLNSDGDNFVDFGIFEARNSSLVNGEERSILLDFNVDGVIIDKI